jgi:hypothetical protein
MKFVKIITMLMAFTVLAFSSQQRVNSLGGNAGFWPDDEANIGAFPASLNNWNIAQVANVGTDTGNHNAYVLWGSGTKWGFSWDESATNDMVNLMWGNGTYGVNFGLGMDATDNGAEGAANVATSSMNLDMGFGMNMGFGEVGAGYSMGSADDGNDATEDDPSSSNMWFNLRRDQSLWLFDKMLVGFSMASNNHWSGIDDGGTPDDDTDDTPWAVTVADAQSTMNFGVNCFTHMDIADGTSGLFAMGFGFQSVSNLGGNPDNSSSNMWFPQFTFAVESSMTDWATARVGVNSGYTLSGSQTTGDVTATDQGTAGSSFGFGLGFNYGSFNLDIDATEGLFTNPVQHVTGYESLAGDNATATITYTW